MALTLLTANNAQTVLAAGISASATTLTVNTGTGSLFPSPVSGTSYFKLTLIDATTGQLTEIVHVTARTGDTMTISRAQEGTTARAWSANDIAANMLTAGTIALLAPLDSPVLTGTPTAPTASAGTNTTQLATTAFTQAAITALSLGNASQRTVGIGTNNLPDMSYFQSLQSASGYQKLPGGLVIQWGPIPAISANSSALISYQIPFPNTLLGYAVAPGASATGVPGVGLQSVDKTQFRAYNQSTSTQTQAGTFVAVGY